MLGVVRPILPAALLFSACVGAGPPRPTEAASVPVTAPSAPAGSEPEAAGAAAPVSQTPTGAPECSESSHCTLCTFDQPFVTEADCRCFGCAYALMPGSRCEAIIASHRDVCASWTRSHVCPEPSGCDTNTIPGCADGRCTATHIHVQDAH
jgi:hypothetical protein